MVVAAGANVLVAGTSVFGADKSVAAAMETLGDAILVAHSSQCSVLSHA